MATKRSTKSNMNPAAGSDVTAVSASGAMTAASSPARISKPRKPRAKAAISQRKSKHVEAASAPPVEQSYPHEEIARLAYSLWEQRGCEPGSPLEDWLQAEKEVLYR